ncbi:MAG TPA: carboxypeptidase-like regulatory domain-containing protein, partial [Candidatus Acidoferrales bacterium]|nr:carboxypeptidase-like regulatory domain-containing protein [Candidatus Acidoferrales bacterium]
MKSRRAVMVLALMVAVLLLHGALASAQNSRGSIAGTVEDRTGARIPFAKITVHSSDTSYERDATGSDNGTFRVDDLLPGAYVVTVSATGFSKASSDVTVLVSSVQQVKVTLEPAGVQTQVQVRGQAASITTEPIDITNTVNQG